MYEIEDDWDVSPHQCHANGCETRDLHPEVPFCKKHFKILPKPHQQKIWKLRPYGTCGVCYPESATDEWHDLVNLAIALICRVEYGRHGCPDSFRDEDGFCWACGCHDVPRVYQVSEKIIKKFNLRAAP